jgi:Ribbon-helix-helix domain
MKQGKHPGGRPRQFPRCERYGAHRFSATTGKCPCGFQRPGKVFSSKDPMKLYGVRIEPEKFKMLQSIAEKTKRNVAQLIRDAISEFIARRREPFRHKSND